MTTLTGQSPLIIQFTDISQNNPIAWVWNFGNGQTSTLQTPAPVTYTTGTYDVSLIATNANGQDEEIKIGYVVVVPSPHITADFVGTPFAYDLYVFASGYSQYRGNFGLPENQNNVMQGLTPLLVAPDIVDVATFPFENAMMATTADGGLFLSGQNYKNLLAPTYYESQNFYAVYNESSMGTGWGRFAVNYCGDGSNYSSPGMVLKSDGKIYEWGGIPPYYGDANWNNTYRATPIALDNFNNTFKFVADGAYGMVAYNGLETWFIGDTFWLADLGTKQGVSGPGYNGGYVATTWEKIQGLAFEPTTVALGNRDLFLLVDHQNGLWAYATSITTTPVLIANDVQYLIPCKPGNQQFGFINSAGEMWYLNTQLYSADIVAINPADPLTNNFHQLLGGPWKWADSSDWSVGLVAIDTTDQAWLFDWGMASNAFWGASVAPTLQINTGGKPVSKVVLQADSAFLLVQR